MAKVWNFYRVKNWTKLRPATKSNRSFYPKSSQPSGASFSLYTLETFIFKSWKINREIIVGKFANFDVCLQRDFNLYLSEFLFCVRYLLVALRYNNSLLQRYRRAYCSCIRLLIRDSFVVQKAMLAWILMQVSPPSFYLSCLAHIAACCFFSPFKTVALIQPLEKVLQNWCYFKGIFQHFSAKFFSFKVPKPQITSQDVCCI